MQGLVLMFKMATQVQSAASRVGRLVGKVVFVTGAAQGIGKTSALVTQICTVAA